MERFEFVYLKKFAKEWNIKIERKLLIQPPTIAARFPPDKALFVEFCTALRFMENLRVKNLMRKQQKKNDEFVKVRI